MTEAILELEDAGHPVVLTVHDEVVVEISEAKAGDALSSALAALPKSPE